MRTLTVLFLAFGLTGVVHATETEPCDVPGHLFFDDSELHRVATAVKDENRLDIAVVGTASSVLAGPGGRAKAYPARMEAALRDRLPGVAIRVETQVKSRRTAADMAQGLEQLLKEKNPVLVIWQSGTVDAMRGVDPEDFRAALEDGVRASHEAGADIILMNMQYSPRTESMIALSTYADNMRHVTREQNVPLFDRLALMRHWSETGAFDLHAATNDSGMAERVHDCIGRALAAMIIDAAHLGAVETKPPQ